MQNRKRTKHKRAKKLSDEAQKIISQYKYHNIKDIEKKLRQGDPGRKSIKDYLKQEHFYVSASFDKNVIYKFRLFFFISKNLHSYVAFEEDAITDITSLLLLRQYKTTWSRSRGC